MPRGKVRCICRAHPRHGGKGGAGRLETPHADHRYVAIGIAPAIAKPAILFAAKDSPDASLAGDCLHAMGEARPIDVDVCMVGLDRLVS
jgi:hypothetical protein